MWSARRITLASIGTIVALAAFEHGLGEWLQGPIDPAHLVIRSWPDSAFYRSLQGEPALTIIPNLAVAGVVTMTLSGAFFVWVVRFVDRPRSALVIAGLSVAILLVGGGFGPPVLGLILAAAATRVTSPLSWWKSGSGAPLDRALAVAWPFLLAACIAAWSMMLVGVAALDYFLGVDSVVVTLTVLSLALSLLPLSILGSFARDASDAWEAIEPTRPT